MNNFIMIKAAPYATLSTGIFFALLPFAGLFGLSSVSVQTNDPFQEIFYAPFEDSTDAVVSRGEAKAVRPMVTGYETGMVGKAAISKGHYSGIIWDGRGNLDLDRGTLAYFYKHHMEPDVTEWEGIGGICTEIEGYWWSVLQFNKIQDTLFFQLFDVGRYTPTLKYPPFFKRWKKDQWYHLAAAWDRNEGVKIYEDGKEIAGNWGKYCWEWNMDPMMLAMGQALYGTADFSVDELHVYGAPLTSEQIAQLAKGQKPTGTPVPITPEGQRREFDLIRMGWGADDLAQVPVVKAGEGCAFNFARIDHVIDSKRRVAQPFEGLKATCWPLSKYGASISGSQLDIHFAPDQSFDRVRLFAQRPFSGALMEIEPGAGLKSFAPVETEHSIWRATLPKERRDKTIFLQRERGWLGQIDFYKVTPGSPKGKVAQTYTTSAKLDKFPTTLAGKAALSETPVRFDNAVRAELKAKEEFKLESPAFGGFQLLTEPIKEPTALEGVSVKLVVKELSEPTPVHIVVKEPIWPQRDWLVADAVLQPKGTERQEFSIGLKGRPIITMPETELAVLVTCAQAVTWEMGGNRTSVGLLAGTMEKVKPIAVADQIEFAREAYAELNEGHIWDGYPEHTWGRLAYPLKWLDKFASDERPTMEINFRLNRRKESLPYEEPKNTSGAPEWAFWQMEAIKACKGVVHWIIDNRQLWNGEFGGVYGDDTDMTENWMDYPLACDDDGKIAAALRRIWDGLWKYNLVEGVSGSIRDNLHSYEEGMGTISMQLLVDYGNPTAIEHTMTAASHYDQWMTKNPDGTYSFISWNLGARGCWTQGDFAGDKGVNGLMFVPACYLAWYNHHPAAAKYLVGWKRNREGGIVTSAVYDLTQDPKIREWQVTDTERLIKESRYHMSADVLLSEVGVKEEWKKQMLNFAGARNFLQGELHFDANSSAAMTEAFWMAWLATGDIKYLTDSYKQACKYINTQQWLYTVAQPSTDRIALPRTTIIRARVGGLAANRMGDGNFYPHHGLSYTRGGEQVAALVTDNGETHLNARFFTFAEKEHDLQLRVWRLLPGKYKVTLFQDKDNDGKPEGKIVESEQMLERGAFLDLKLPPGQGCILDLTALETKKPVYDKPDPAIGPEDVKLEYASGHLSVTVHNVGVQPAKNILVRVVDGRSNEIAAESRIAKIDPPLDLKPKTETIEFHNLDCVTRGSAIVVLDPNNESDDFNRYNNKVIFKY